MPKKNQEKSDIIPALWNVKEARKHHAPRHQSNKKTPAAGDNAEVNDEGGEGSELKIYLSQFNPSAAALELFSSLKLYIPKSEDKARDVQSKLAIQKSYSNVVVIKGQDTTYERATRVFQCQCGIDNEEGRFASKKRQMPWANVGCQFHVVMISTHLMDGKFLAIDSLTGLFDHTAACNALVKMDHDPLMPLHPEIRNHALDLLRMKSSLHTLRHECKKYANECFPGKSGDNVYRYELEFHDSSLLYQTLRQEQGVYQRTAAEDNLNKWFRATEPSLPSPFFTASCLHYQAHIRGQTDRFEMIIATPEMCDAAWKHGHKKQVLMDLMFGFCSAPALLLILMALNEHGKGLPIALIVFTAHEHVKAAHTDYNELLITQLLGLYKEKLGFKLVATTNNDNRERKALSTVFPGIWLILCAFHTPWSWCNGLNHALGHTPKGEGHNFVCQRLAPFIRKLLHEIEVYSKAMALYNAEKVFWTNHGNGRSELKKKQAESALRFLKYLDSYLKSEALWVSWSKASAIKAAKILGVAVEMIARTNNPLESFNST
ncbi:hypothetical protein BKA70DRAFT_1446097 [Coprinopsis sp. MPI-PUGE-AT-0042]|nr:hypothetical protein BKA70DRAFT_1446097 [Coprinopsis sp. MPI-PUGE-AT-0042]